MDEKLFDSDENEQVDDLYEDEDAYLSSSSSTSSNSKNLNNASTRKIPKPSINPPLPPETPAAKHYTHSKKKRGGELLVFTGPYAQPRQKSGDRHAYEKHHRAKIHVNCL